MMHKDKGARQGKIQEIKSLVYGEKPLVLKNAIQNGERVYWINNKSVRSQVWFAEYARQTVKLSQENVPEEYVD
jgi:hypothetical protein